jgi:hypothetical protein
MKLKFIEMPEDYIEDINEVLINKPNMENKQALENIQLNNALTIAT